MGVFELADQNCEITITNVTEFGELNRQKEMKKRDNFNRVSISN